MTVGERLRKRRDGLGKSQSAIAAELKVTQPRVAQIESGDTVPSHLIASVAQAYGVEHIELLGWLGLLPKKSKKAKGAA